MIHWLADRVPDRIAAWIVRLLTELLDDMQLGEDRR